jgi:hypothetical protein
MEKNRRSIFLCFVLFNYCIKLNDSKQFKKIGEYAREHGIKLYIYYLKEEDAGEYECYLPNGQKNRVRLAVLKNQEEPSNTRDGNYYLDAHDETRASSNENSNEQTQPQTEQTSFQPMVEKNVDENAELVCGLSGDELTWKKIDGVGLN